jgi:hypothetical protein
MQRQTARQQQLPLLPRGAPLSSPTRPLVLFYKKPLLTRPNTVDADLTGVTALSSADINASSE